MAACSCCPPGAARGHLPRRGLLAAAALACSGLALPARAADDPRGPPRTTLTPDQALARLMERNEKFLEGDHPPGRPDEEVRHQLAAGQAPFAAILTCGDSRVAPELLFASGLGELFVARNAGNIADVSVIGSMEYAVAALGVPLVMVLGHERCGAIAAAISVARESAVLPGLLGTLVEPLLPAAALALRQGGDVMDGAVRANVRYSMRRLQASLVIGPAIAAGKVKVVGARYDLDDGKVTLVD